MSATVQQPLTSQRFPTRAQWSASAAVPRSAGLSSEQSFTAPSAHQWLVDLHALHRCRALLRRHGDLDATAVGGTTGGEQSLMDVPRAYDLFCRSHFTSVRRIHPELTWDDACPAYAVALSAHAVLCIALDEEREQQLKSNWEHIRGHSNLDWSQARTLVADGCSALDRLDPLAMHR